MITEKQSFNYPGTTNATEVYYTITSNDDCVSVTPSSGTVSPGTTVEHSFIFKDEACFSTVFTVSVWDDACETPKNTNFIIPTPCSTLDATLSNSPSSTNPYIFTAVPSGGNPGYKVKWKYDTAIFDELSSQVDGLQNVLELSLKDNSIIPTNTVVGATVTDSKGCKVIKTFVYTFCQPVVTDLFVSATCTPSNTIDGFTYDAAIGGVELNASTCAGTTNDWDTLELNYDTNRFYITNTDNILTIYVKTPVTGTTFQIYYTVTNTEGIKSTQGTVNIFVPICAVVHNPIIQASATKLLTADTPGTVKTLDLTQKVFAPISNES